MTYTVKNGTWCKDNDKEYYSTTKAGLKAALAAGEITAGTKVVIHEPKYHAGQLIQSLNPECPEGCFVPNGQAFNTSIYEELAKVFPSGVLPDMRECVLVMAGQNEHITTHAHDVFAAGEFKDDCAVEHSHEITVTDPGHGHSVTDPGHKHTIDISDPGHDHGRGTFEITGSYDGAQQDYKADGTGAGAFSGSVNHRGGTDDGRGNDRCVTLNFKASNGWTGRSETVETGITASAKNSTAGISVDSNTTGITASCSTTGSNVTRTKQFGVYYYIAF